MKERNEIEYEVRGMKNRNTYRFDERDMSETANHYRKKQFLSVVKNSDKHSKTQNGVFDIYEREMMEELFENDELSAEEEAFMAGYLEA